MLGKNLLWVAKQHGHSVQVMLRCTPRGSRARRSADITRSNKRWKEDPIARANAQCSISDSSANAGTNRAEVDCDPSPESPEFGSSLAVGNARMTQVSEMIHK